MRTLMQRGAVALCAAAIALPLAIGQVGAAGATIRPISDWVDGQDTYFDPGADLYFMQMMYFLDPATERLLLVDYAGIAARWIEGNGGRTDLMPDITGQIVERPLADGRALVQVQLRADHALMWGWNWDPWLDMVFGYSADEILDGATPTFGSISFKFTFINDAPGAPMPHIFDVPYPDNFVIESTTASGIGPLREGSGYPAGSIGKISTRQLGLDAVEALPRGDGWPVEWIRITAVHQ